MKRILLFVIALICTSIGAWAGPAEGFEMKKDDIGVWFAQADAALTPEKVIKIEVTKSGGVKAALDELAAILAGTKDPAFREKLDEGAQGATDFIADNRLIVKLVYKKGPGANDPETLTLSDDDISALNNLNIPTIDLQDLKPASAFTLSNSNVKNLILPDEWTMAQVEAAATGCSNLNAALSIGTDVGAGEHADHTPVTGIGKSIVAYVKKPGTLYQSTRRLGYLDNDNTKLGHVTPYTFKLEDLKLVTIKGTPSARDFNGCANNGDVKFDPDGHLVFDREADETSKDKDAGIGGTRQLLGTAMSGALTGANLTKLDLGGAIITDAHCSDLTISWSNSCVSTSLKEIVFPTTDQLTTLPADCLNGDYSYLEELCIPGNIKVLKTRACYISTNIMRHIWTTGNTAHMVYDNGAYMVSDPDNVDHYGHAPLDDTVWNAGNRPETNPRYGTITLPEGLTLIESHNFTARSVSDVYVLTTTAPECHVDAFSTIMYLGNNTIDTQYIQEQGMVTRQAYAQSVSKGEYITFLHYPDNTGTPDIQRYTDPTREYSVATTLRDGKGNVIYFPNQSELNRAYLQGTTGYLWYAWDSERIPDTGDNGDANSFKNCNPGTLTEHTTAAQQQANGYYTANNMTDPDKTDRTFYDVRLGTDGQPVLNKPVDLEWYYDQYRSGKQLYPEMQATNTDQVIGQVQKQDSEGHLLFVPGDCDYIQDYEYVKQDDGELVWVRTITENPNGSKVRDYNFVAAADGAFYHPMVNAEWNSPKPWYLKTESYQECDRSVATHAGPNGNTGWLVTIDDWNAKESTEYSWAAGSVKFYRLVATWTRDDTNGQFYVGSNYALWSSSVTDYITGVNDTRYDKVYTEDYRDYNADTDAGETRYDVVDNGLQPWDSSYEGQGYDRYHKQYIEHAYREFNSSKDDPNEKRYCPDMEDVYAVVKGKQNDYRGWHQFILHAYHNNEDIPSTPVKFYQTDNDWWTVCLPYDLKYNDMKKFFGNETTGAIPYLSKLLYVVRDYDKKKITLMFSKNLMVYKEAITNPSATDDYVHGVIDDETPYSTLELEENPIILHKGVPYLIKPNIDVNANRSFKIYKEGNEDLYKRLNDAQYVDAGALATYIYKGEYTVPAYVIGANVPEETVASRSFAHAAGPTFTYSSSNPITYEGEKVNASISNDFCYTFVGSFFLSVMPKYSYFLGWDSSRNRAAFWYNRVPRLDSYDWNNQTGIICPNFNTSLLINPATDLNDPAKWTLKADTDIKNDDLIGVTYNNSKYNTLGIMDWGGSVYYGFIDDKGIATDIKEVNNPAAVVTRVYTLDGVYVGNSVEGLAKGVYVVNGKKYVVK